MTADNNPYSAPDAELGVGQGETYSPAIFSFQGRLGRLRYLAYGFGTMFAAMLVMIPLVGASAFLGGAAGGEQGMSVVAMVILAVVYIAIIVLSVMFAKRRFNDLNRSGWWILLTLVPIVNIAVYIYMMFFPGTEGSNDYGPAPEPNSLGVQILGWGMIALFVLGIVGSIAMPVMMGVGA